MAKYETPEHQTAERAVADELAAHFGIELRKHGDFNRSDYCAIDRKSVTRIIEIKCREYTMERLESLGGYFISLGKYTHCVCLSRVGRIGFAIAVRTTDGLWLHEADGQHDGVVWGGRTDRGDPNDVEPVVVLRRARFQKLR